MKRNRQGIQRIFAEAAATYEPVNRVLTLGLDLLWRRAAIGIATREPASVCLDICSGTGETAAALRRAFPSSTTVIACDFSRPMLAQARRKKEAAGISFVVADAAALPFRDDAIELVTMSFAARNLRTDDEHLAACLRQFNRVLQPGGRFVCVESSQPTFPPALWIFRLYVRLVVKPLGTLISGSRAAYTYLASTIPTFHGADRFSRVIKNAGFSAVSCRRLSMGAAAVHRAVK